MAKLVYTIGMERNLTNILMLPNDNRAHLRFEDGEEEFYLDLRDSMLYRGIINADETALLPSGSFVVDPPRATEVIAVEFPPTPPFNGEVFSFFLKGEVGPSPRGNHIANVGFFARLGYGKSLNDATLLPLEGAKDQRSIVFYDRFMYTASDFKRADKFVMSCLNNENIVEAYDKLKS